MDRIEKANRILDWMHKKCKDQRSKCPCVDGVMSDVLLAYLKKYHPDLTEWISDLSDPNGTHMWIETGLLEQLVELYMGDVKVSWCMTVQQYQAVEA